MASRVTGTSPIDAMARYNEFLAKMQAAQGVTASKAPPPMLTPAPMPQAGGADAIKLGAMLGGKIGMNLWGGQAAAPAIMANLPAPAIAASAAPAMSGLGAATAAPALQVAPALPSAAAPSSALGTFGAYAGPLAVLATAPIWAPKLGGALTNLLKGKDYDRRFDVNEVTSPLKGGGMTQFQKAIPNWAGRSEDERKNIAQKAYDLKVLNLIGDPSEDMGLMGDARNPNSEQLHIGSKLMSFDRKMSRGEEPKWKLRQDMERIPTAQEILNTGFLKKDYRERLADFVTSLQSPSPTMASVGASIDPGRIPSQVSGIMAAPMPIRSRTSSPGIDKNGRRISY